MVSLDDMLGASRKRQHGLVIFTFEEVDERVKDLTCSLRKDRSDRITVQNFQNSLTIYRFQDEIIVCATPVYDLDYESLPYFECIVRQDQEEKKKTRTTENAIQPMSVEETTTLNGKKKRCEWCARTDSSYWCWYSGNDSTVVVIGPVIGTDDPDSSNCCAASDSNCCDGCDCDCDGCDCDCDMSD